MTEPSPVSAAEVEEVLRDAGAVCGALDEETVEYIAGMLSDEDLQEQVLRGEEEEVVDIVQPMLLEGGAAPNEEKATELCHALTQKLILNNNSACTGNDNSKNSSSSSSSSSHVRIGLGETTTSANQLANGGTHGTTGGFVIADRVAEESDGARKLLNAEQLQAQFCVPTLPEMTDKEKAKLERRKQRDREKAEKEMEHHRLALAQLAAEAEQGGTKATIVRNQGGPPIVDLHLEQITVDIGGKELVNESSVTLTKGRRYGLCGRNGTGKTTLLRYLCASQGEKGGRIKGIPSNCQILHVAQEVSGDDKTVLQAVLECDVERKELLEREKEILRNSSSSSSTAAAAAGAGGGGDKKEKGDAGPTAGGEEAELERIYDRLTEIDAHGAPAKASKILYGLSFDEAMQNRATKTFSGGWRMRIALARALFVQPDLLLLDEPTNHLDLHAVIWLEEYLIHWPTILVVVSHSRGFLDYVSTDIVHLHAKKLTTYSGNYSNFEKTRAERIRNEKKSFESQDARRKHLEDFIRRFRYNAKRATLVQSRIKALQRMADITVTEADPEYVFTFPDPGEIGTTGSFLSFNDVSFAYNPSAPTLFENVSFGVDLDSRIALVGANGAGKTTLLKLMTGELQCTRGQIHLNSHVKICTFSQHHVDGLDLTLCPLEYMTKEFPNVHPDVFRGHLASFGLPNDLQTQNMYKMSGGQKSRVAFAKVTFTKPHILLLDEPSNHLDMDAVDALIQGLNEFKGCVILVSHDEHLISATANELWVCADKDVSVFNDSFLAYKKSLAK